MVEIGCVTCHADAVAEAPSPRLVNLAALVALGLCTDVADAVEAATQVSTKELAALTSLANWADGRSIDVLRSVLAMSQPGCARLVDRLATTGLAERARDARNRRVMTVRVTALGRETVRRGRVARAAAVEQWLGRLDVAQTASLEGILDRLAGTGVEEAADPAAVINRRCRLCDPGACGFPQRCAVTHSLPES